WVTKWAKTWVTLSPHLVGSERVFAAVGELLHTSSQTPPLGPLRACDEVCRSSCSTYGIPLVPRKSVTHVFARRPSTPSPPPREERAGERRPISLDAPLLVHRPARSLRGRGKISGGNGVVFGFSVISVSSC